MQDHSAILIIPADLKAQADAVGAAMGWGEISYTIPLGDGETVTHYGARADVSEQFVRWIRGDDPLPDPAFQPLVTALIADFSPDPVDADKPVLWGAQHFEAVLTAHTLQRMT